MDWYYVLLIIIGCIVLVCVFLLAPGSKRKCLDASWLYKKYIAHRGLFNNEEGIIENSETAFKKAIEKGFYIESIKKKRLQMQTLFLFSLNQPYFHFLLSLYNLSMLN